ncbi:MAG: RNA 2',3'-cyclic phosphodiesterase [Thermoprotei archaeon]|nr:RNA 2',3'-cyclic phosphodiesterase [TACK group archaeon]
MRVFVAVDLPDGEAKAKVLALLSELHANRNLKVVAPENLHFTLAFIGEVSNDMVKRASEAISRISYQTFNASLSGIGYFPSRERARVVWVGIKEEQGGRQLEELAELVRGALSSAEVPFDEKPFVPHLTLARAREGAVGHIDVKEEVSGQFQVAAFSLKRSVLTGHGPIYSDLVQVKLL